MSLLPELRQRRCRHLHLEEPGAALGAQPLKPTTRSTGKPLIAVAGHELADP
jgi:hypothetical protein